MNVDHTAPISSLQSSTTEPRVRPIQPPMNQRITPTPLDKSQLINEERKELRFLSRLTGGAALTAIGGAVLIGVFVSTGAMIPLVAAAGLLAILYLIVNIKESRLEAPPSILKLPPSIANPSIPNQVKAQIPEALKMAFYQSTFNGQGYKGDVDNPSFLGSGSNVLIQQPVRYFSTNRSDPNVIEAFPIDFGRQYIKIKINGKRETPFEHEQSKADRNNFVRLNDKNNSSPLETRTTIIEAIEKRNANETLETIDNALVLENEQSHPKEWKLALQSCLIQGPMNTTLGVLQSRINIPNTLVSFSPSQSTPMLVTVDFTYDEEGDIKSATITHETSADLKIQDTKTDAVNIQKDFIQVKVSYQAHLKTTMQQNESGELVSVTELVVDSNFCPEFTV